MAPRSPDGQGGDAHRCRRGLRGGAGGGAGRRLTLDEPPARRGDQSDGAAALAVADQREWVEIGRAVP